MFGNVEASVSAVSAMAFAAAFAVFATAFAACAVSAFPLGWHGPPFWAVTTVGGALARCAFMRVHI